MINRSHRCNINNTRPRHGYEYTKYKMYLSMVMVMCKKQHLSDIRSLIYEKINNTEAELKERVAYKITCVSVYMMSTLHSCILRNLFSSIIIEDIKAVFFFFLNEKRLGPNKSVKVSSYIHTFANLLSPIFFCLKKQNSEF